MFRVPQEDVSPPSITATAHQPMSLPCLPLRSPIQAAANRTRTCHLIWCSTTSSPSKASSLRRTDEDLVAQPYIGEIRMFAGNFAPAGWMLCQGQLMPISENEILFQLIGTTYGGDGESTFALPDLQGRIPIHQGTAAGTTYQLAEAAGVESVTLTTQQIPLHTHQLLGSANSGTQSSAAGSIPASGSGISTYRPAAPTQAMATDVVQPVGGSQPHDNMHPYLCVSFIISLFGLFPSQT